MPALLTRMSRRPRRLTVSSIILRQEASLATSTSSTRRLDAELGQLRRGGLRLFHVAPGDRDGRAGLGHAAGHAEADAAVAAGDDRDAAFEVEE